MVFKSLIKIQEIKLFKDKDSDEYKNIICCLLFL